LPERNYAFIQEFDKKKNVQLKVKVVQKDEFEKGDRKLLNFGHTLGHAIEKHTNYKGIKHGEAISHGMLYAVDKGIELNITPSYVKDEVSHILHKYQLLDINIEDVSVYETYMRMDKKQRKDGLRFVCIKDIGIPVIYRL